MRIFEINSATVRHKITTNWIPDLPVGRLTNICFNDEGSELVTVVERGGGQGMARIWKMRYIIIGKKNIYLFIYK